MGNEETYITKNGELTTRQTLITEIEQLLNLIPTSSYTTLSSEVMAVLSCEDLESMRDSLFIKTQDVIGQNRQWLLGLADS